MRGVGMIEIVGVFQRVAEHEGRIELAVDVDRAVEMLLVELERIVAAVEELDLGAEQGGGALGLVPAAGLDLLQRRARLLPGELALAALAIGQADDFDAVSLLACSAMAPPARQTKSPGWAVMTSPVFCVRHGR